MQEEKAIPAITRFKSDLIEVLTLEEGWRSF